MTETSGLTVSMDEFGFGVIWAEWLVKKLNGKGSVIMVTGVAGTFDNDERNKGAESVWTKNPDIKVIARYTGMWGVVQNLLESGDTGVRRRPACESLNATGRAFCAGGGPPPRVKRAGAAAVPGRAM